MINCHTPAFEYVVFVVPVYFFLIILDSGCIICYRHTHLRLYTVMGEAIRITETNKCLGKELVATHNYRKPAINNSYLLSALLSHSNTIIN